MSTKIIGLLIPNSTSGNTQVSLIELRDILIENKLVANSCSARINCPMHFKGDCANCAGFSEYRLDVLAAIKKKQLSC